MENNKLIAGCTAIFKTFMRHDIKRKVEITQEDNFITNMISQGKLKSPRRITSSPTLIQHH